MAASSCTEDKQSIAIKDKSMQYYLYPPPVARFEDVIGSAKLFMDALGKFHAAMGTKFKIPIIGGKDLDLYRLFTEVTSRGGIKRVLEDKKWREVTNSFCFPPSATNASFILRKYYMSLIHHFEQVYYFKAKAWTPVPTDTWQSTKSTLTSTAEMKQQMDPSAEIQVMSVKRQRMSTEDDSFSKDLAESSIGLPVTCIIDGKFESGYLCTVRIGGEQLQGVLYQTYGILNDEGVGVVGEVRRRRRRKKAEMRKRDPNHPKPNRSGYNFFFAEQHSNLRLLHTGKERGISRMIGHHWNKLTDSEKAIYQEKAKKDKERYRIELAHYKERLRGEKFVSNALPLQQQYFMVDSNMMSVDNTGNNGASSYQTPENDQISESCDDVDSSNFDGTESVDKEITKEELIFGDHNESFKIEDNQTSFLDESVLQKVQENESIVVENESKKDGNHPDLEPRMPDINDKSKKKSADNQQKDSVLYGAENLEKDPQVFQETVSTVR